MGSLGRAFCASRACVGCRPRRSLPRMDSGHAGNRQGHGAARRRQDQAGRADARGVGSTGLRLRPQHGVGGRQRQDLLRRLHARSRKGHLPQGNRQADRERHGQDDRPERHRALRRGHRRHPGFCRRLRQVVAGGHAEQDSFRGATGRSIGRIDDVLQRRLHRLRTLQGSPGATADLADQGEEDRRQLRDQDGLVRGCDVRVRRHSARLPALFPDRRPVGHPQDRLPRPLDRLSAPRSDGRRRHPISSPSPRVTT